MGVILISPAMKVSENLDELLMLAKNNGTAVKYVSAGDRLNMPSLKVDFIWPVNRTDFENINDGCLVFLLKYKDFDLKILVEILVIMMQFLQEIYLRNRKKNW